MFRRILVLLVSLTGVSIKAEEILVKISNRIFSISVPESIVTEEKMSSNQLIDLLKGAKGLDEIIVAPDKKSRGVGTWTETSVQPGTWTESAAKVQIKIESNTTQSGQ